MTPLGPRHGRGMAHSAMLPRMEAAAPGPSGGALPGALPGECLAGVWKRLDSPALPDFGWSPGRSGSSQGRKRCAAEVCAGGAQAPAAVPLDPSDAKCMRLLRQPLGRLRLRHEAHEGIRGPGIELRVEADQLRAIAAITRGSITVTVGLAFPPQYPHHPPKVFQLSPSERLPCWGYIGELLDIPRVEERCWTAAMGVADIVQDLVEALDRLGPAHQLGCFSP